MTAYSTKIFYFLKGLETDTHVELAAIYALILQELSILAVLLHIFNLDFTVIQADCQENTIS